MKIKTCSFCGTDTDRLFYANPKCCTKHSCKKKYHEEKKKDTRKNTGTGKTESRSNSRQVGNTKRKATGELSLFMQAYAEAKGVCEVTGKQIKFHVSNHAHILSKGAYAKFRLYKPNIVHVDPHVHHMYDNGSEEALLAKYSNSSIIYDRKRILKPLFTQFLAMTTLENLKFVEQFAEKHGVKFDRYTDFDFEEAKFSDSRTYHLMDVLYDIGQEVPVGEIESFHDESGIVGKNSFALWYEKRKSSKSSSENLQ